MSILILVKNMKQIFTLTTLTRIFCVALLAGAVLGVHHCIGNKTEHAAFAIDETVLSQKNIVPLAILGSGNAGLAAAIYGARGMVKTLIIQGSLPGGLLTQTTEVENWPGERTILGPTLMGKIRAHAMELGAEFLEDSVERVDLSTWPYVIYTEDGKVLHALSIIIATGAAPITLGIPGEQEFWGRGVGTCAVCDAAFYKGEDVVVVGGGDSAIEEAIQLAQYAQSVTILVRKDNMRAAPRMQDRLKGYPSIKVMHNVEVKKITGNDLHVTGIELYDNQTGQTQAIPINGLFLAIGHTPNSAIFKPTVKTDANGYILLEGRTHATNVPGIFAAGEVEDNRYRQAITSAGQGVSAALDALNFLSEVGFTPSVAARMDIFSVADRGVYKELPQLANLRALELESAQGLVVLDFYTKTCASCNQMMPVVAATAQQFAGRVKFFKVDAEEAEEIAQKFFVYRVPCLVVLKDGVLVARYNETMNRKELTDFVEKFLEE